MQTNFNCYKAINILNPDGTVHCPLDFSFSSLDLSFYGGNQFETIIDLPSFEIRMAELGYEIKEEDCNITILTTADIQDIPSFNNPTVNIEDCETADYVDLTFYGGGLFYYTEVNEIKLELERLLEIEVIIENCIVTFIDYEDPVEDITTGVNPIITYENCTTSYNNNIQVIDFTFYGGTITEVSSEQDIINEFSNLGINVNIEGCSIELLEFTDPVEDLPSCLFPTANILNYTNYDLIDFSQFGGNSLTDTTNVELEFSSLGYEVNIVNGVVTFLNKFCETFLDIPTSLYPGLEVFNISKPDCIQVDIPYTMNLTHAVSNSANGVVNLTEINGNSVQVGDIINTIEFILEVTINGVIITPLQTTSLGVKFNFTLTNEYGISDTANVSFCSVDIPMPNPDTVIIDCNTLGCVNTVTANDITSGTVVIESINGVNVVANQSVTIQPGLVATLSAGAQDICIESTGYSGMGQIPYTITNGTFTGTSYIDYTVNSCNSCSDYTINFTSDCGELCWTNVLYQNSTLINYSLKLLQSGNYVNLPNGSLFEIGAGTYSNSNTLPANSCIPFNSGSYDIEITTDLGTLICSSFTHNAIECNGNPCTFFYSGTGGVSSNLSFDIEVCPNSNIIINNFNPQNVPDGIVMTYNGNVIYHTGLSPTMPYVSLATTSFVCSGVNYTSQLISGINNVVIPVPYITGINLVQVNVLGNPCQGTAWSLDIECQCI